MTGVLPEVLADPRTTLAVHGRSFHHGARLLGHAQAARAARLYAWCRHVDDLADEAEGPDGQDAARTRLRSLATSLVARDRQDPLAAAVLGLCDEVRADPAPAMDLVVGVAGDLEPVLVPDERALVRYGYAVAGTVGLLMLPVLDVRDPRARPFAIDLGIAMQLTNIARDVVEDARAGRRYLPTTWVGDVTPAQIVDPTPPVREAVRSGVGRLLALAERYYASGEAGLVHLPVRSRLAIRVATRVYRRIGHRLARRDHDVWAGRTVVSPTDKAVVTVGSLVRDVLPGMRRPRSPQHDRALHLHLVGCSGAAP